MRVRASTLGISHIQANNSVMIHVFMVYTLKGCERSCSSYTGVGFYPCFHCCLRAYGILRSWQSYYCKATMRILSSDKYRSSSFFAMPLSAVDAAWYFFGCVITIGFRYLLYSFTFRFTICSLSHEVQEPTCLVAVCRLVRLLNSMLAVVGVRAGNIGFMLMPVLKPAQTSNIFIKHWLPAQAVHADLRG